MRARVSLLLVLATSSANAYSSLRVLAATTKQMIPTPAPSPRLCATGGGRQERAARSHLYQHELKQANRQSDVERMLNEHPPKNVKEYSMGIAAWARARDWRRAVELLSQMKAAGVAPNVYSFSSAITACAKGGEWQEALSLLEEMQRAGVEPNAYSWNGAIAACARGGQWQRAVQVLDAMCESGVEPTVVSYNSAISACERAGQWEEALSLLVAAPSNGVRPDVITFNAAISACAGAGRWAAPTAVPPPSPCRCPLV